jgi:hypothetical protein
MQRVTGGGRPVLFLMDDDAGVARARELLTRFNVPFHFHAADSEEARRLLGNRGLPAACLPVVIRHDDYTTVQPTSTNWARESRGPAHDAQARLIHMRRRSVWPGHSGPVSRLPWLPRGPHWGANCREGILRRHRLRCRAVPCCLLVF